MVLLPNEPVAWLCEYTFLPITSTLWSARFAHIYLGH
jgi:hypothetical protein